MNEGDVALKLALELQHMPSRVRYVCAAPLPGGLDILLRVAAGDDAEARRAAQVLERQPALVITAARFFVEQVLLAPDADCYRMLGAEPTATAGELRRNMALILRVLHPDVEQDGRSILAQRVTGAWDRLKTPEKREAYDNGLMVRADKVSRRPKRVRVPSRRRPPRKGWRRVLAHALGMKI